MPQCPGCGKSFSRGYSNHLQQTQKPACRAVLAQAFGELWFELSDTDSDTESSDSDMLVVNHLDSNFEDFDFNSYGDEEDFMYSANDYGEAPVPEQLEEG